MLRSAILAAIAVALLASAVGAQPGSFQVVDVTVVKGKLQWTETQAIPVTKQIEVTVNVNGKNVVERRAVTVHEHISVTKEMDLKGTKVTDGAGKAIAADKVAELLKDKAPVVLVTGPVAEKHRKLFKETTVFVELPAPGPVAPGIVVPAPVPLPPVVAPGPVPPIVLPPGEKKM
jgi:hypothetical protein